MKPFFNTILFLLIILLFNACSAVYVPISINTPLLDEKKETQINLSAGGNGANLKTAYAATNNLGVMINGSWDNHTSATNSNEKSTNKSINRSSIEFGTGYFQKIDDTENFEIFIGGGFGHLNKRDEKYETTIVNDISHIDSTSNSSTFTSYRIFIQPGYGIKKELYSLSIAGKLSNVYTFSENIRYNHFIFEPVITAKFGPKFIKSTFQMGYMFPISSEFTSPTNAQRFIFSIGVQANLFLKKKK